MPAVHFEVRWPDGEQSQYYSPSTIIHEHLKAGMQFKQTEFANKIHVAMTQASERVYQRFGYYCSAASDELARIESKLTYLTQHAIDGDITIVALK